MQNNTKIIGDSERKSRFDPDLAKKVNKEVDEREKAAEINKNSSPSASQASANSQEGIKIKCGLEDHMVKGLKSWEIDNEALCVAQNQYLVADQFAFLQKYAEQGKAMASMADFYFLGKTKALDVIGVFQDDLKKQLIIANTDLKFSSDHNVAAKIIHYWGSGVMPNAVVQPITAQVYGVGALVKDIPLSENIKKQGVLAFCQALFGAADSDGEICRNLEYLLGTSCTKIFLKIPESIDSNSRAVVISKNELNNNNSGYTINCDYYVALAKGISRGVKMGF